jgi:Pentapeptide repeats (8 copies)
VDLSATNKGSVPLPGRKRKGLRRLSPDLIGNAIDETNAQVTRIGLTFLGTAAFCLLSLLSPDSALLGGSEKINVPLAGPVSFFGFMLLGPTVLIMLRGYLQIYVEHSNRLEQLGRSMLAVRAPTLVPLKNPLIRVFSGLIFYLLLPMTMILFAWKAAVFPAWGSGLLCAAVGIIAGHAVLPLGKVSWRSKALLSVSAAIIAGGVMFGFGPLRRSFDLYHADLSNQWLPNDNLSNADLSYANLSGAKLSDAKLSGAFLLNANLLNADLSNADLSYANLSGAKLSGANLLGAYLTDAKLSYANLNGAVLISAHLNRADLSNAKLNGADLRDAKLNGANLLGAKLIGAKLSYADLSDASLTQANELNEACGDVHTKLPADFTVKLCPAE